MDSGEIKDIGPNLTATTSAETSGKGKEKAKKSQMVSYTWSFPKQLYERRYGWQHELHSRFPKQLYERRYGWQDELHSRLEFKLRLPPNFSSEIANEFERKLKDSKGFLDVDSESRSFEVAGFYRVYPYYDWDPDQIKDQKAILNHCCDFAVSRHNQRTGDHLNFFKLVSANMLRDGFPIYFITLEAYRQNNKHLTTYRTKVQYIRYHGVTEVAEAIINIHCFRPFELRLENENPLWSLLSLFRGGSCGTFSR